MPVALLELAVRDVRYYRTAAWCAWFGRKMQRKRELVILGAAAKEVA